jgi:hypothetical protein
LFTILQHLFSGLTEVRPITLVDTEPDAPSFQRMRPTLATGYIRHPRIIEIAEHKSIHNAIKRPTTTKQTVESRYIKRDSIVPN